MNAITTNYRGRIFWALIAAAFAIAVVLASLSFNSTALAQGEGTATATATPDPTPTLDQYMQLKIDGTTSCLAVDHGTSRYAEIRQRIWRQYCADPSWSWDTWTISEYNGGYQLKLKKSNNDGDDFCLDARANHNGSTLTSSRPGIWECLASNHGSRASQTFKFSYVSDGKWKIYSSNDVWLKDAGQHQTFRHDSSSATTFEIASATTASNISWNLINREVQIKIPGTNDCLDLRGGMDWNGINFQRYACNGTDSQTFNIWVFNGGYQIYVKQGGFYNHCIDTRGDQAETDPNFNFVRSRVHVWDCVEHRIHDGADNQTFQIKSAGNDRWHIFAADEVGLWARYVNTPIRLTGTYYTAWEIEAATGGV